MVKQYELMVLLSAGVTQDQIKAFQDTVTKLLSTRGGKIDSFESLGKRQLAYRIRKQEEAYYLLFIVSLDTTAAQAFERDIRLMDEVMRSLFLIVEEKKAKKIRKSVTIESVQE